MIYDYQTKIGGSTTAILLLTLNSLLMIPILLWGTGVIRPWEGLHDSSWNRKVKLASSCLLALTGYSTLHFLSVAPAAYFIRWQQIEGNKSILFMFCWLMPLAVLSYSEYYPGYAIGHEVRERVRCRNHLKEFGIWLDSYESEHGHYPAAIQQSDSSQPYSWRVEMVRQELGDQLPYDITKQWDAAVNVKALGQRPTNLSCPSVNPSINEKKFSKNSPQTETHYALVTGQGTINPPTGPLGTKQITDGLSFTIISGEATGLHIPWTEPRDISVDTQPQGINLPTNKSGRSPGWFSSVHKGGAFILMADGSVQWINQDISPSTLKALTTAHEGEPLTQGSLYE